MFFRGQILGKYKILAPLGSGGFGAVYLAQDTWIDKKVAIKVPHRQALDFGELLKEPRLLATLNHPTSSRSRRRRSRTTSSSSSWSTSPARRWSTSSRRAARWTCRSRSTTPARSANAVDHAHRQNVIHRDLRPANVLVSETNVLKVADFGTSRFLEIAAHGTTVIGSPPYMAPEQFKGQAVFASDIYSLGVTMYQMLTGALPYETPSPAELERLMRGELVTPPRARNGAIPKAVSDIVMRAMAPDVAARYQRASDLLADLLAVRPASPRRTPPAGVPPAGSAAEENPEHPPAPAVAGGAGVALLLELPQAAPGAQRPLPVLWRIAVMLELTAFDHRLASGAQRHR